MGTWDGSGLPPAAAARLRRAQQSWVATSLLSVPSALGLAAVGFDPVGEVMGCVVTQLGWQAYGGCGMWTSGLQLGYGLSAPVITSRSPGYGGFGGYVEALSGGFATALARMVAEATALGADGVVGVKLTAAPLDSQAAGGAREFVALGTAVRGRCRSRPPTPFTTELRGAELARLLLAGWTPVALTMGIEVSIRHDDWRTRSQSGGSLLTSALQANVEVEGYTDLVQQARAVARADFSDKLVRLGADGAVISDFRLRVWELEPAENHIDHAAEAVLTGTAIARLNAQPPGAARGASPSTDARRPLTILPLRQHH